MFKTEGMNYAEMQLLLCAEEMFSVTTKNDET